MLKKISILTVFISIAFLQVFSQPSNLSDWKRIGNVKPRSTNEIKSSSWLIGCETLDRDYANYDAYKEHLVPLGIKKIRLQGGWAKTEKVKGVYDWTWLDHIINDAVLRGLKPWLQTSYGNPIYNGGGGANLSAGLPVSTEAFEAWDRWVEALVIRYKDRVKEWEVWNEPNNIKTNAPEMMADLTLRTIDIINRIQPQAKISGLAMGHIDVDYANSFVKLIAQKGKLHLLDNITYHGYNKNPDQHFPEVAKLRLMLDNYNTKLKLRQGENGAPSKGDMGGAISNYDWTELSQAKWDLRRMLGDLGHDVETSLFTIIDLAYDTEGPIKKLNVKGLIESDMTKKFIRRKLAYSAVQNVTSIFDDKLERIKSFKSENNAKKSISVFAYRNKNLKRQLITAWFDGNIPTNTNVFEKVDFTIMDGNFKKPVLVDMVTGAVYEIPKNEWKKTGDKYSFSNIPVSDFPVLIADASTIHFTE